MAPMKLEVQLDEQPPEKKLRIDNCHEEWRNSSNPNESGLPKSLESDKESTTLPSSRPHYRKLPPELNQQIFLCFSPATQRKFICGLGWDFYAMFRHKLLTKSKRLCNPTKGNRWETHNMNVKVSEDGLNASNIDRLLGVDLYAMEGFPISREHCREDNFPGTICYYYEVKLLNSARWCEIGLTDGEIFPGGWIGRSPNSYAIDAIGFPHPPNGNFYSIFRSAGQHHLFEFPEGVIRPKPKETENVYGCGLLMNSDDKVTIFFTLNGILIGRQFPIDPTVDHLIPTVTLWDQMSLEANFGDNPAKPFEYDIKKCPGMGLEWI